MVAVFLSHGVSCDTSGDGLNHSPPVDVLVDAKGEFLGLKHIHEVISWGPKVMTGSGRTSFPMQLGNI